MFATLRIERINTPTRCMFLPFIDDPEIDVVGYLNILVTCFILECVCYLRQCINRELLNSLSYFLMVLPYFVWSACNCMFRIHCFFSAFVCVMIFLSQLSIKQLLLENISNMWQNVLLFSSILEKCQNMNLHNWIYYIIWNW